MPRKTKENQELENKEISNKTKSKSTTKKSSAAVKKTTTAKKSTSTVKTKTSKKTTTNKKTTTSKKATSSKKTSTTKKASSKKKEIKPQIIEYYDLPQKYNQTTVKILAQTPKTLFIYWEISDDDINKYKEQFGVNFFETTKPVLIIHNDTLNYSFEVDINDFANSWYLHVNDTHSDYRVELGRRPIKSNTLNTDYIFITSSNEIEAPNDHILFNTSQKMVYFRNVKTNLKTSKSISSLSFMKNMGKIYDIYDLYQELYKNEDNLENLSNPSSNTSSQFK